MNDDNTYINTKKAREILSITAVTLRKWNKEGRISAIRTPSGQRMYNKKDVFNILGIDIPYIEKKKVIYCRVSSKKQKDDLDRQVDFLREKYPLHTVITDIASGINWKRKGLTTILELTMSRSISEIVVSHRDRLCRFGFELLETIFKINDVKLIVLNNENGESSRSDLADDILSIIHIYSCKEMGKRRYSKVCKNKNISELEPEKNNEKMDRNNEICL